MQSRNIDLHTLEVFDALMRERNVSRVAERMGMSQSSASDFLARLRERFGDQLLVRTGNGMTPTARAEELLLDARVAMQLLRDLMDGDAGFDPLANVQRFRITASDYTQLLLMPPLTRRVATDSPHSSVDVLSINLARLEAALDNGEVDLAVAYHPDPPAGLRRSPLFTDRLVCIARTGHRSARPGWSPREFAAMSHIGVAPSGLGYFSVAIDSALSALGLQRHIAVSSPHFLLAAHLVSQTDLLLALPARAAAELARIYPVQIIELPIETRPIDLAMYWHERCHQSKAQQWLRGCVKDALQVDAPPLADEAAPNT